MALEIPGSAAWATYLRLVAGDTEAVIDLAALYEAAGRPAGLAPREWDPSLAEGPGGAVLGTATAGFDYVQACCPVAAAGVFAWLASRRIAEAVEDVTLLDDYEAERRVARVQKKLNRVASRRGFTPPASG